MTQVWAGMATLNDRIGSRAMAVTSLLPQVDRLIVASGEERGDQAKFLACAEAPDDVVFIGSDDDLIYPPDYVATLLAGLERYPDAIVSFHGWTLSAHGEAYAQNYRCLENVHDDVEVHVAGTGVCAFKLSTIRPHMEWFETVNADVWLAVHAEDMRVPRVVLAHRAYWLGYSQMPGSLDHLDDGVPLSRSVYSHTRYKTGTTLDGSAGFERATGLLHGMIYG